MTEERVCSEVECDAPHYARGWCAKHYKRWLRTGETTRSPIKRECSIDGCANPVSARGWCHSHYQRWYRTGDVAADKPLGRGARPRCSVDGCPRLAHARCLCQTHYRRLLEHGEPRADVPIRAVTGDGFVKHGYLQVPVPPELRHLTNGETNVLEHRLIMARHLGRPLRNDENVHHRNGDRLDNRLENLELWSTAQPRGQRVEDKVAFAVMILERYAPHLLKNDSSADHGE